MSLILDGTKIQWYQDRIRAWRRGEHIAPVTIDMALTRACNYRCVYCYSQLQDNPGKRITERVMTDFLTDAADIGVKGISLVSDGESTLSPAFEHTITFGHLKGLAMAVGTNGYALNPHTIETILPCLTYLRFNISAGEESRYNEIMRPANDGFRRVIKNIKLAVFIRNVLNLDTTIGLQMVLMPEFADQILPLSRLAVSLGVDYLLIKHCSDDEEGQLGVNYEEYERLYPLLIKAQHLSNSSTSIIVKWSKIRAGSKRTYKQCYGPPFILQLSGSGLVAPCGMLFNEKYKEFHIGNITEQRFKDIWASDRYWEVMNKLASKKFNAKKMCGCLCLQHNVCKFLDDYKKGLINLEEPVGTPPKHKEFI